MQENKQEVIKIVSLVKIGRKYPVIQIIISLMSSLMKNLLTVAAKVFSNRLIFLLQFYHLTASSFCNEKATHYTFFSKNINVHYNLFITRFVITRFWI